ncbi:unnamed protein product, partial [Ectocarpus fasciculatus]
YLTRIPERECIDSNIPFPGRSGAVSYEIVDPLNTDNQYHIRVCESVDGSMGSFCDSIVVRFGEREILYPDKPTQTVLVVEKVGYWK